MSDEIERQRARLDALEQLVVSLLNGQTGLGQTNGLVEADLVRACPGSRDSGS